MRHTAAQWCGTLEALRSWARSSSMSANEKRLAVPHSRRRTSDGRPRSLTWWPTRIVPPPPLAIAAESPSNRLRRARSTCGEQNFPTHVATFLVASFLGAHLVHVRASLHTDLFPMHMLTYLHTHAAHGGPTGGTHMQKRDRNAPGLGSQGRTRLETELLLRYLSLSIYLVSARISVFYPQIRACA